MKSDHFLSRRWYSRLSDNIEIKLLSESGNATHNYIIKTQVQENKTLQTSKNLNERTTDE